MNIKRGLFRVWVVLSAAYVIALGAIGSSYLYEEFKQADFMRGTIEGREYGYPVKCEFAKGVQGTDWIDEQTWKYNFQKVCWFTLESFKHHYPQHRDTDPSALLAENYRMSDVYMPRPQPWWTLAGGIGWAIGLPLFILAIGSAIYWALAGFARKPQAGQ
jgi:hypothetical protein